MKWNIDDVPVFLAIVEQSGITAAARTLGMPKSTVSTALTRLEHGLGLRLLDRNSRNLRVTSEGETFYRQAVLILEQVREADAAMAGRTAVPSGRLSVALPPAFAQEFVAPNLSGFHAEFPEIELDLIITAHGVDLLRDSVDLAVVVGPQEDSELMSKTLLAGTLILVSSPAYLDRVGLEQVQADILPHIQICEKRYGKANMPVHLKGRATYISLHKGISHANDPLVVRRAVQDGAGVSPLPKRYCRDQLTNGTLIEVRTDLTFGIEASKLTVVYPSRRLISPRTRVFLAFLQQISR